MTQSALPPLRGSYESLIEQIHAAVRAGDYEEAIALYRRLISRLARLSDRVLQRRPDLHDLHRIARLELSGLLAAQGRYAEAIEVEDTLLETHPDEAHIWRTDLAVLRIAKGEVDAGLSELHTLAQQDRENPWRWLVLGREARLSGRLAESREALDRALAVCGEDGEALAEAQYQRFQLFREWGELDEAVAAWEAARRREDWVSETVREVYTMLTEAGCYEQALQFVEQDENKMQALFQRGLIAERTGNRTRARAYWQQVAALNPDEFEYGHDAWVEAMLRLNRARPALEWLERNLLQRGTVRLMVLAGIGWVMEGDDELAAHFFQQAIDVLRYSRPPRQKLDSAEWRLLDSLVIDQRKVPLKKYFAVVDTLWDAAGAERGPAPTLLRP
ncbi:MAG TPA: tetratricopeptide repeat protein [Anaerolineae bacterium]|nr:tetratricopeptide repeat protein [Anaerolineae bacterium]